ncbi:MAG: transposase [Candidatus Methylomirabilota bacterium]
MPRAARLDAPGAVHHVIIRGIERRNIFKDDRDREELLERLGRLLPDTKTACYAWALLPNHAHFLFRSGPVPLATLMRRLLTGYAVWFNRRHRRHGYLFQNRYKSIVCQEDHYLRELVRYIHLNPFRAGLVPSLTALQRYPYCGHSVLLGNQERSWQGVPYVLGTFGKTLGKARKAYQGYVADGVGQGRREDLIGGGLIRSLGGWAEVKRYRGQGRAHLKSDERILGDSDFVEEILARGKERYTPQFHLRRQGYDLERIAAQVANLCRMDVHEIFAKGRHPQRVQARSLLCFWAVRQFGIPLTDIARRLDMSPPAIGYSVQRGEAIARERGLRISG